MFFCSIDENYRGVVRIHTISEVDNLSLDLSRSVSASLQTFELSLHNNVIKLGDHCPWLCISTPLQKKNHPDRRPGCIKGRTCIFVLTSTGHYQHIIRESGYI